MSNLLVKCFIKDSENVNDASVRSKYGILSGIVGVITNVILCAAKFFVGSMTGSIAIIADAANNLSDAGSSLVTLIGFKMSGRPADKEHPFGHGRMEYITAMIVSFIILFMGIELAIESVDKIRNPENVTFSIVGAVIIGVSILGKVWLAVFNRSLGKKIHSPAMTAVVADSLSDIAATSVTLIALILSHFYPNLHIDGILGIVVACFVLKAGLGILKDTANNLIGLPPTQEMVQELHDRIMSYDYVMGIHDLMIHNYGPDKYFASVHVEMPSDVDVLVSHNIIDNIERDIEKEMGIILVVHYDPLEVNDERVYVLRELAQSVLKEIDERYTMHDFRVVDGPLHSNLIFDVVIPYEHKKSRAEIADDIAEKIHAKDEKCFAVVNVEHSFV
ncbi:MAG: cation diffusion facilitator family transporter [Clostridia bacterium]|nr:cation diffusion facilitator family transporter [Clostridia bacterium]